jgi:uncharacterized protein (TIGR02996 family)
VARKRQPEHDAFLAAIIETPDDDAPRLVYADWLDEHGGRDADRARAEFIREQVRLHQLGDGAGFYGQWPHRLRDLHRKHARVWEKGLPEWATRRAVYERGFIADVTATARQWLKDGALVRSLAPIQRLRLDRPTGLLGEVASAGLLAGLTSFAAYDTTLTADDLQALANCSDLNGVTRLMLGRCRLGDAGARVLAGAPWLAGIEETYLSGNDFGPKGAAALGRVPFRCLEDLDLFNNPLGDAGAAALMASPHLPAHLTRLILCLNRLGPASARAVAECAGLAGLSVLSLERNAVGDDGARALAESPHLAGLELLDLRETRITDKGAAALAASPHLAGLTQLDLYDNPIAGEGIFELLNSPHLKQLASLSVYSPKRKQDEAALQAVRDRFDRH